MDLTIGWPAGFADLSHLHPDNHFRVAGATPFTVLDTGCAPRA